MTRWALHARGEASLERDWTSDGIAKRCGAGGDRGQEKNAWPMGGGQAWFVHACSHPRREDGYETILPSGILVGRYGVMETCCCAELPLLSWTLICQT